MTSDFISYTDQDWILVIKTQELSLEELNCYASHLPDEAWKILPKHQNLNSRFILDFYFKLNMPDVIQHQKIHQDTIENNLWLFEAYMWHVCRHQYLTEEFLLLYHEIINWRQAYLNNHHFSNWFLQKTFKKFYPRDEYIYSSSDVFHEYLLLDLNKRKLIDKLIMKHNDKIRKVGSKNVSRP